MGSAPQKSGSCESWKCQSATKQEADPGPRGVKWRLQGSSEPKRIICRHRMSFTIAYLSLELIRAAFWQKLIFNWKSYICEPGFFFFFDGQRPCLVRASRALNDLFSLQILAKITIKNICSDDFSPKSHFPLKINKIQGMFSLGSWEARGCWDANRRAGPHSAFHTSQVLFTRTAQGAAVSLLIKTFCFTCTRNSCSIHNTDKAMAEEWKRRQWVMGSPHKAGSCHKNPRKCCWFLPGCDTQCSGGDRAWDVLGGLFQPR